MASFETLFPTFLQRCADLRNVLMVVPFLLVIVGLIMLAIQHPSVRVWTRHFVRIVIVMSLLVFLPRWGDQVQQVVADTVTNTLHANPNQILQAYKDALAVKQSHDDNQSLWDVIASFSSYLVNALIGFILWLFSFIASLLLFWAYILQKIIVNTGYALSPILIGFMAVPPLSGTGSRYLANLLGVLLWPLGWGVAALISQGILDFMTDQSFLTIDPTSTLYSLQNLVGLAVLAFWTIFSTIAAPVIIQKVLTEGMEAGSRLLSGGIGSFLQTAQTTAAAATLAGPAGKPLLTAATAGLAATLSTLSVGSGIGNAGSIILSGPGAAPRTPSAPNSDLTGDRAVRDLIAAAQNKPRP